MLEFLVERLALLNSQLTFLDEFAEHFLCLLAGNSCCADTGKQNLLQSVTKLIKIIRHLDSSLHEKHYQLRNKNNASDDRSHDR